MFLKFYYLFSYLGCFHRDCGDIIPANILFGQNLLYLASMYNKLKCEYCRCRLNISCSETTNNCAEKLKSDVHPQYCCECGKDASTSVIEAEKVEKSESILLKSKNFNSSTSKESSLLQSQIESFENFEKIKEKEKQNIAMKVYGPSRSEREAGNPKSLEIEPKDFNLLVSKETISCQQQVKSLEQMEKGEKNNIAVRVSKSSEMESNRFLDTLDVTEHRLDSCSLPQCGQSGIERNPIHIKLSENVFSENSAEEQMKSKASKNDEDGKEDSCQVRILFIYKV